MQNQKTSQLRILHAIFAAVAICLSQSSFAQDYGDPYYEYRDEVDRGEFSYDDSRDTPWIETLTAVPDLPDPADLMEVELDQLPPGMTLLVDKARITVDKEDGVVRSWLFVRNNAGVENGSFEGFRCNSYAYKIYAYGNHRRTPPVARAKSSRWIPVKKSDTGNYRWELMSDYFCGFGLARSADDIASYLTGELERDPIFSYGSN